MNSVVSLLKTRRFWLWILLSVSTVYLVLFCIHFVITALHAGMNMSTYPSDGTFQLFNPLRRIQLGQTPGLDFPFFHGLGVPLLHYPVYLIAGGNLFAAEVAKWLVSPMLFYASTVIFMYAFFRDIRKTIVGSAVVVIVASIWLGSSLFPTNSLLGVRVTLPLLAAAALVWQTNRKLTIAKDWDVPANIPITICLLGLAFLCGTEQGIAAMAAYVLVRAYGYWTSTKKRDRLFAAGKLAAEVVVMACFTLLLLAIVTNGHVKEALHYALIDIPADQGWYFGAPPNAYLSWDGFIRAFNVSLIPLVTIVATGILATWFMWRKKILEHTNTASLYLLGYGTISFLISSLGYFAPIKHLVPLGRGAVLIAAALFVYWAYDSIVNKKPRTRRLLAVAVLGLAISYTISATDAINRTFALNPAEVISNTRQASQSNDDIILSSQWKRDAHKILPLIPENASIWSTYTGVYDSLHDQLNPSSGGEDYIIHALGDERRQKYAQDFIDNKPDYVITIRANFFIYEEWLWGSNWEFYRHLFTHYEIVPMAKLAKMHVLWVRKDKDSNKAAEFKPLEKTASGWKLPKNNSDQTKLYEIRAAYKAGANLGLSFFDKVPRYFINIRQTGVTFCPISLPPAKSTWTFPAFVGSGKDNVTIDASADGIIPMASLDIKSLSYREVHVTDKNAAYFADNSNLALNKIQRRNKVGCDLN